MPKDTLFIAISVPMRIFCIAVGIAYTPYPACTQTTAFPAKLQIQIPQTPRNLSIYEEKLNRISADLGALHALYALCIPPPQNGIATENTPADGNINNNGTASAVTVPKQITPDPAGGNPWRAYMQNLLAALQSDAKNNARLTASFNRSYHAFADNYSSCTAAAKEALLRYRLEGQALSRNLIAEFSSEAASP